VASEAEWGPDGIASAAVQFGFVDLHLTKLSSGEIAFVSLYSALGRALGKSVSQNYSDPFFVFIDEGETFMHPRWQQRYISNLIDFISKFPNLSCRAHIIISTHSLIVAADAPPNSLFDMQKSVVRNGFGLGPKSILHDVFRVENFAGENASKGINKILSYLKEESEALAAPLIAELAKNLADRDLREYVRRAMIKRGHHAEAERIAG